jgi:hypothetical protein
MCVSSSPILGEGEPDSKSLSRSGRGIEGEGCKSGMHPPVEQIALDPSYIRYALSPAGTPRKRQAHSQENVLMELAAAIAFMVCMILGRRKVHGGNQRLYDRITLGPELAFLSIIR